MDAGETPNFWTTACSSKVTRVRRFSWTIRVPRTHWARSLSGVQMMTRSTRASRAAMLANYLRERATAANFKVYPVEAAVYEEKGYRPALDCDLLFSCVSRPSSRHV